MTIQPPGGASGALREAALPSEPPVSLEELPRDRHRNQTALSMRSGDRVIGRATITRKSGASPLARLVRIVELTFDIPAQEVVRNAALDSAVGTVVRRVGIGAGGVWDVLVIQSPTHGDVVSAAAWQFATTMDYGCDILPRSDDGVIVRIRVPGRRAAIAHFLLSAPDASGVKGWARSLFHRLRRRAAVAGSGGAASLPEVHMILELPPVESSIQAPPAVQFHEVSREAVSAHPRRYASYGIDTEMRVSRGDRCFASEVDGRVVFRMWVSTNARFIRQRSERLGAFSRAAYVYDSYTEPDWRGRSIRGASLRWLAETMASEVDRIVLSVNGDNLPSIRAARKAGFQELSS